MPHDPHDPHSPWLALQPGLHGKRTVRRGSTPNREKVGSQTPQKDMWAFLGADFVSGILWIAEQRGLRIGTGAAAPWFSFSTSPATRRQGDRPQNVTKIGFVRRITETSQFRWVKPTGKSFRFVQPRLRALWQWGGNASQTSSARFSFPFLLGVFPFPFRSQAEPCETECNQGKPFETKWDHSLREATGRPSVASESKWDQVNVGQTKWYEVKPSETDVRPMTCVSRCQTGPLSLPVPQSFYPTSVGFMSICVRSPTSIALHKPKTNLYSFDSI